jgi:hypothetical protein
VENVATSAAHSRLFIFFTTAALCVQAALMIASIRQEAQTWDESTHLAAGYSYWKTGDYRISPDHPPVAKMLESAPLLFMNVELPATGKEFWRSADAVNFGATFLYTNRLSADDLLFPARCVTIAMTIVLGLSIALWTRAHFGVAAALTALTLYVFDPNIIAHGRYVTTDLAVTLFAFLTIALWGRPVLCGIALGLALGGKFSAIFLLPVLVIFALISRPRWRSIFIIVGMALVVLAIACRGHLGVLSTGFQELVQHNSGGHVSYLFGRISNTGWWYYFPAVLTVKWPTATLAMLVAAVVLAALKTSWRRPRTSPEVLRLMIPVAVFFGICLFSRIDIGVRHLLPMFPFVYILIAVVVTRYLSKWVVIVALAGLMIESTAVYPNYLAFFNVLSGGPSNGPRMLLDSNIDWGQDTKKLKAWLDARGVHRVCRAYFGNAILAHYGIEEDEVPAYDQPEKIHDLDCLAAMSVTPLYGLYVPGDPYRWLREREPVAKIGYSIYVYDLRKKPKP